MILRNGRVQVKKLKKVFKKTLKSLSKIFAENGKKKLFLNDS